MLIPPSKRLERIKPLIPQVFTVWSAPDISPEILADFHSHLSDSAFIGHCLKLLDIVIRDLMTQSKNMRLEPYIMTACITHLFPDPHLCLLIEEYSNIHTRQPPLWPFQELPSTHVGEHLLNLSEAYPLYLYRFFWRFMVECLKLSTDQLLPSITHSYVKGDDILHLHHRLRIPT